jgi:4'-phosphopantetheinyl transferase
MSVDVAARIGARRLDPVAGVELWSVDLDAADPRLAMALLEPAEAERAARHVAERDRMRFAAGRAAIRAALGARIGRGPAALRFAVGEHGKPSIAGGPAFSFSRADGLAMCAISDGRAVGIDIERVRPIPEREAIAESCFTQEERAHLVAGGGADADLTFLRCWTRKEAYLKALGLGLGVPGATQLPFDDARFERIDLAAPAGYVAAMVVERDRQGERS